MAIHALPVKESLQNSKLVRTLTLHDINFERIAITNQTIKDFELEKISDKNSDTNTLEKLKMIQNYQGLELASGKSGRLNLMH